MNHNMKGSIRIGLSMGITGDDPGPFTQLARDLGIADIVVCHQLHETPENGRVWKALFDKAGLRTASWALPNYYNGMWESEADRRAGVDALKRSVERLAELGIDTGHTFVRVRAGEGESERASRRERLIDMAREVCAHAGPCGVRIAHHFGWTPELIAWNTETALAFIRGVDRRECGLLYCPGSYYSAGDDALDSARRLGPCTFLIHARDARGTGAECESLHLGQGSVPYRRILKELQERGCDAIIVPEHLGPAHGQRREETAQAMAAGYLRGIMEGL